MKKIFFAAMLAMGLLTTAQAQVMRIETEQGTKVYDLSKIKSVSFSDEVHDEDMVALEVLNASPIAFDLQVTKSPSCQKYMVAVYPQAVYSESNFVFAAEQTLDKDAYYRPFENTLSYENGCFSEAQLGLNTLADDNGKPLKLVAAVYAVDDLGTVKVQTQDIVLPTQLVVESEQKMKIEVDESTLTYDYLEFAISQQGWARPAKIIWGVTEPANLKTTANSFMTMSEENQRSFLMEKALNGVPQAYTNKIQSSYMTSPNSCVIIFALPTDGEGKVGEMAVKVVNTPALSFTGKGSFTSCSLVPQTEWNSISFNIGVDENTAAYRLLWVSKTEDTNSDYTKSKLPEIFQLKKYQDYGICREFPATATNVTIDLFRADTYILYGATVDSEGNVSTPVDLLKTYVNESGVITTMEKPSEE